MERRSKMNKDKEWYQNEPDGCTVTFFGRVASEESPCLIRSVWGAQSYECSQGYEYMKSLRWVRKMVSNPGEIVKANNSFIYLYWGLYIFRNRNPEFSELGSTFFEAIDRLEAFEKNYKMGLQTDSIRFIGIETSEWFCDFAEFFHEALRIEHYDESNKIPFKDGNRVSYTWCVPNYAHKNCGELAEWLCQSRLSVCGIWFSTGEEVTGDIMGKRVVLFSLSALVALMKKKGYVLYVLANELVDAGNISYRQLVFLCHNLQDEDLKLFNKLNSDPVANPAFDAGVIKEIDVDGIGRDERKGCNVHGIINLKNQRKKTAGLPNEFDFTSEKAYRDFASHLAVIGQADKNIIMNKKAVQCIFAKAWKDLTDRYAHIFLYGAGSHASYMIEVIGDWNMRLPDAIWDDKPRLAAIGNIPVSKPFISEDSESSSTAVVVASDAFRDEILNKLKKIPSGKASIFDFTDLLKR